MINTNLLSAMANNAAGLAQNPAVAGAGIAAVTAGGIYKIIRDARQSNESLINTFNTPTKLKNPYSNIIKISTDIPRLTATLLAKLVVVSERSLEHTMEYGESKKDTRSLGAKLLHQIGYEKNPIGQVLNWMVTGQTPAAVNKVFGFDKKGVRKEEHTTKDRAELIGTSTNMARLLGQTAQQIVAGPGTYESKMFKLTLAQTDLLNFIGKGVTTIWKSSGTKNLISLGETPDQDDSWLGKLARLPKTILNLPGINAAKNLVKGATSIVTAPFKMYAKLGIAMDKIRDEVQNFRTGGLFKAQNEADLAKKAGYKVQDFKTFGLPNVLSGITHVLNVIASRAGTQVTLLSTIANVKADTTETDDLIKDGPKVWDQYSGRYVTKKQLGASKKEMIRRAYNQSFLGSTKSIIHGTIDRARGRTSDESYQRELDRTQQVYGDAIGIDSRLTDSGQTNWLGAKQRTWYGAKQKLTAAQITQRQNLLDDQMSDPQARLGGLEETQEIFGERRRNITGSTGYQRSGALTGSIASMTEFGLGLTSLIPGLTILSTVLGGLGIMNSGRIGGRTDERFRAQGINTLHGRILSEGDNQFNDLTNLSTGTGSGSGTFIPSIRAQYVPPDGLVSPLTLTPYGAFTPDITPDGQLIFTGLRALEYQAVRLFDLMNTTISSTLTGIKTSINDMYTDIGGVMDSNILIEEMKNILESSSTGTESIRTISNALTGIKTTVGTSDTSLNYIFNEISELKLAFTTKFSDPLRHYITGGTVPGNVNTKVDNRITGNIAVASGEEVVDQRTAKGLREFLFGNKRELFNNNVLNILTESKNHLVEIKESIQTAKVDTITSQQTTTANIVEELKAQVIPEGEQRQTEIVEKTRWEKLISATQETKDVLKGKISGYLRDAWEKSKFGKKEKLDSSSGLFGGLGAALMLGGSWLFKKIFGKKVVDLFYKILIKPIVASLKLLIGDAVGAFKWVGKSIWSMIKKPFVAVGEFVAKKLNPMNLFKGEGFIARITKPIFEHIGGLVGRIFGSGGFLKGAAKLGLGFLKRLPGISFLFGAWDAVSGFNNASEITGQKNPSFFHKIGAGVASVVSGLTFGIVEPKTIYSLFSTAADWISEKLSGFGKWFMNTGPMKTVKEFFGYTDEKDQNPERSFISRAWGKLKDISKDVFAWACDVPYLGAPMRLIRDTYNYLFDDKMNEKGEMEPSFICKAWDKFLSIGENVMDFICDIPVIGMPLSIVRDAYNYMFGDEKKDDEPSFITKAWEKFTAIGGDKLVDFMCTIPIYGMPFRLIKEAYDYFFVQKPEDPQKSFITKVFEFFDKLTPDSILTAILGPMWGTVKNLYNKVSGGKSISDLISGSSTPPPPTVSSFISSASAPDLSKFADAPKGNFEKIKSIGSSVVDKAKDLGGKAIDKAKSIGSSVIEGAKSVWKGLTSNELTGETVKLGTYKIRTDVYKAIQQASEKYGVPLDYMLAMAAKESAFNPDAKAKTSSATGLYQFIKKTWASMWGGSSPDPTDPVASADAGARYAKENQKVLGTSDPASLYLGHFLGTGGAKKLLTALRNNPNTPATDVVGKDQAAANSSIFKPGSTVKDIYDWSQKGIGGFISKIGGQISSVKIDDKKTSETTNTPVIPATPPVLAANETNPNNLINNTPDILKPVDSLLAQAKESKPTRTSQNIQPVGSPDLVKNMTQPDPVTPPVTQTPEKVSSTQSSVPSVSNTSFAPPPVQATKSKSSGSSYDQNLLATIDRLFNSVIVTFTQTANKSFVFGDSMNMNPIG